VRQQKSEMEIHTDVKCLLITLLLSLLLLLFLLVFLLLLLLLFFCYSYCYYCCYCYLEIVSCLLITVYHHRHQLAFANCLNYYYTVYGQVSHLTFNHVTNHHGNDSIATVIILTKLTARKSTFTHNKSLVGQI